MNIILYPYVTSLELFVTNIFAIYPYNNPPVKPYNECNTKYWNNNLLTINKLGISRFRNCRFIRVTRTFRANTIKSRIFNSCIGIIILSLSFAIKLNKEIIKYEHIVLYYISYIVLYYISYIVYRISYIVYRISYIVYRISYIVYRISYIVYRISYIVYRISYIIIYYI